MIGDKPYYKIPISRQDDHDIHLRVTKPEDSKAVNGEHFEWICLKKSPPDTVISKSYRRHEKHWDNIVENITEQLKEKIEPKEIIEPTKESIQHYKWQKEEKVNIKRVAFEQGLSELSSPVLKENG